MFEINNFKFDDDDDDDYDEDDDDLSQIIYHKI